MTGRDALSRLRFLIYSGPSEEGFLAIREVLEGLSGRADAGIGLAYAMEGLESWPAHVRVVSGIPEGPVPVWWPTLRHLRLSKRLPPEGWSEVLADPRLTGIVHLSLPDYWVGVDELRAVLDSPVAERLEGLGLRGNELGLEGVEVLASHPAMAGLRWLDLRDCSMDEVGLDKLLSSPYLGTLERLMLSGNYLGQHVRHIGQRESLNALTHLALRGCGVGSKGLMGLAGSPFLRSLESLGLSFNDLGHKGIEALAASEVLASVKHLDLSDNSLRTASKSLRALANTPHPVRLSSLNLGWVRLSSSALKPLMSSPVVRDLKHLDLTQCWIGDRGVAALASAEHLAGLETLSLDSNEVGVKGATALARAPFIGTLRRLSLRTHNNIGPEGARALALGLGGGVRSLDLHANEIGDAGVAALVSSEKLASLEHLDLSNNGVGLEGVRALVDAAHLGALDSLRLDDNPLDDACASALADAKHLASLSSLSLSGVSINDEGFADLMRSPFLSREVRGTFLERVSDALLGHLARAWGVALAGAGRREVVSHLMKGMP